MARLFDDLQSEYLKRNQAVLAGTPLAISVMAYFDDLDATVTIICIGDASLNKNFFAIDIAGSVENDPVRVIVGSGAIGALYFPSAVSVNTWHHIVALFLSSTSRYCYVDGVVSSEHTIDITPSGLDETTIGSMLWESRINFMSGRVAEVGIWDLTNWGIDDAGRKAAFEEILPHLAAGEPPGDYTTGLAAYWPLRDDDLDYVGNFDLTPINTPSWAEHPNVIHLLDGTIPAQSGVIGSLQWLQELAGLIEAQSALTGDIDSILPFNLAGLIEAQSGVIGNLQWLQELTGAIEAQSSAEGYIRTIEQLNGLIEAQSTITAKLRDLSSLSGTIDAQSTSAGSIISTELLAGLIEAQSNVQGFLQLGCGTIPPALQAAIIDPYSGGAWLWLVEIKIPGYSLIRLAKNTEDITYAGMVYSADSLNVGLAGLSGDGSVPRTILQVAQDADYTLEDKINATKGASGGWVKIIRAHEDYLDKFIAELEDIVDILTADSDTFLVNFQLGIPNPLLKKIPLRRYSSKICPYHIPGLFKGAECQYSGNDPACGGKYIDCLAKENEIHFGADIGLDPNAARI